MKISLYAGSKRNLQGEQVCGSCSILKGADLRVIWVAGFANTLEVFSGSKRNLQGFWVAGFANTLEVFSGSKRNLQGFWVAGFAKTRRRFWL
jgi:hypothetical protein